MTERRVRVRFAPSPTGPLHIGGVRTALFNYLLAKKHGGDFILRIEDTDQTRYVEGAEEYIIKSFQWCGLNFDEGVGVGGNYGPYRQSERKAIYRQYAETLVNNGNAYYAFDTPEELETMRTRLQEAKANNQQYGPETRNEMKNSLTLSQTEVNELLNNNTPYVIRFKMPENETLHFSDKIRGEISVNTSTLDDKVLFKSDGMPTYHLANVVDDYLMNISHVIRGEEWLPSLPLHVLLYRSFGWLEVMPEFSHLPLILKPNGKGKLSKRDGDQLGFPVFPMQWFDKEKNETASGYKEAGYFPQAFINMLALLGWNAGTEQEIFTMEELIAAFSLEKVGKSGSKFDPEKTKWFNQQYMRLQSNETLANMLSEMPEVQKFNKTPDFLAKVCNLVKERAVFVKDIWEQGSYFFQAPTVFDDKTIKKQWKENTPEIMTELKNILLNEENFEAHYLEEIVKNWVEQKQYGFGKVMNPLRLILVGGSFGVHIFDIITMIGKEETIRRIDFALNTIKL